MSEENTKNLSYRFLSLTSLNTISNIMVPLAGTVDIAFLGHLKDLNYLAGVALATIVFIYLYRTCKFLRMGTTGATAQAEGRSDRELTLLILLRNGLIALILGLSILAVQYPLKELVFSVLNASLDVKLAAQEYYDATIWGAPAVLCNFVLMGWLLGREKSNQVLILSLLGNGANIVLDYLLILRWDWHSAGAGLATAISQYLLLVTGLTFIVIEGWFKELPAIWKKILDLPALKQVFDLNLDIWIRSVLATTVFAAFINLSASWGTLALVTNSLLLQVVNITIYFIEGSAFATESLAGNFHGEGLKEQLSSLLKLSFKVSVSLGIVAASLFILLPGLLFGLLTNHLEAVAEVKHYLYWLLPVLLSVSFVYVLEGYFLGLTEGVTIRNSMVAASTLGFVPAAAFSWWFHNLHMLWFALLLFEIARIITLGIKVPKTLEETVLPL